MTREPLLAHTRGNDALAWTVPKRLIAGAATLTLAVVFLIIGLAPSAQAVDGLAVSAQPCDETGATDGRSRFIDTNTNPGTVTNECLLVSNVGTVAADVRMVISDAYNNEDGEVVFRPTNDAGTGLDSWIIFTASGSAEQRIALAPGESSVVRFSISIPADATPGDRVGAVLASVTAIGPNVDVESRLATRIVVRVAGELTPRLVISNLSVEYNGDWWNPLDGSVRMFYTVSNVGNVSLATNLSYGVNTWFGIPTGESQLGGMEEVLPGNARNAETVVEGIPALLYLNPWIELTPFVPTITPELEVAVPSTSRDAVLIAIPWVVMIALGISATIAMLVWVRRRRDAIRAEEWIRFTEREARLQAAESQLAGAGARSGRDESGG